MNYAVVNLGCKVNRVESDDAAARLAACGVETPEAEADLIVVNTCTVTGEAEKKTRKAVRHALSTNDGARVVVTGCASELSSETFAAMDDRVVVVPKAGADLYLSELEMSGTAPCETPESFPASPADGRTRIGIKVQDGCDNACTYCIVHVARGRATSRPADEVVAEAVALAESGVREVVLTGINLGSYDDGGTDLTPSSSALAVRLVPGAARDGAPLRRPRVPPAGRLPAGERPLHRADHRHHRGLPRRDR